MTNRHRAPRGLSTLRRYFEKLVDRLRKSERRQFDMGSICTIPFQPHLAAKIDKGQDDVFVSPNRFNECGTHACIAGHMAMVPEFRKRGLRLALSNPDDGCSLYGDVVQINRNGEIIVAHNLVEIAYGMLGISHNEASVLFFEGPLTDTDPQIGLDRINALFEKYREGLGDRQQAE